MQDPRTPHAAPFTVIELLTVIALLGILVAITVPLFSPAKREHVWTAPAPAKKP